MKKSTDKETKPAKAAAKKAPAKSKTSIAAKKSVTTKKAIKKSPEPAKDSLELAIQVAQGMFEKKGEEIRILDMRSVAGASADFFVISHAESDKQVEAIANSVEEEVHKISNEWPRHREGYTNMEWILLDYFDVVAHVFQREKREFYAVEELWGDSEEVIFKGK